MTIAKHSTHTFDSETYRALERHAAKRGFFDTEIVKQAADQAQEVELPLEATGDLLQDLCKLADGLRAKGFDQQANTLERNILIYKSASSNLYDVTGETGDDLLDFAHPEGDVTVVGEGELAKVETQKGTAKKVREIAEKAPTGKAGSKSEPGLVRQAQGFWTPEGEGDFTASPKALSQKAVNSIFGRIGDARKDSGFTDWVSGASLSERNKGSIIGDPSIAKVYTWLAGIPQASIARYNRAVRMFGGDPSAKYIQTWAEQKGRSGNANDIGNVANWIGANVMADIANEDWGDAGAKIAAQWPLFKKSVWNFGAANNKMSAISKALVDELARVNISPGNIVGEDGKIDVPGGLASLQQIRQQFGTVAKGANNQNIKEIIKALNPAHQGSYDQSWNRISKAIAEASSELGKKGGVGGTISGLAGSLDPIIKRVRALREKDQAAVQAGEKGASQDLTASQSALTRLENLQESLRRFEGRYFTELLPYLPSMSTNLNEPTLNVKTLAGLNSAISKIVAEGEAWLSSAGV